MTQPGSSCSSCGAALIPEARFCVKCGQPVVQASQPAPTPPPLYTPPVNTPPILPVKAPPPVNPSPEAMEPTPYAPPASQPQEQVLCVVGMVSQKTGLFSSLVYHMAVTNTRLIFALQTKEMLAADASNARDQAKQQNKNIFGQIGAQMSSRSGDKYLAVAPDLILAENPQNFMIPLDQLKVIETYSGDFEENAPDTMVVKTFSDKLTFTINHANTVQRELKPVLGNRVK